MCASPRRAASCEAFKVVITGVFDLFQAKQTLVWIHTAIHRAAKSRVNAIIVDHAKHISSR